MTTKILALLVMLLLSASLAGAAVCEDETDATGGYTVTPAKDAGGDAGILWIYDTITQGETNWHSKIVSTNINTLNVDLNWATQQTLFGSRYTRQTVMCLVRITMQTMVKMMPKSFCAYPKAVVYHQEYGSLRCTANMYRG